MVEITEEMKKKHDKIRASGRNFNEEFMVRLWQEYHYQKQNTYKLLYYNEK